MKVSRPQIEPQEHLVSSIQLGRMTAWSCESRHVILAAKGRERTTEGIYAMVGNPPGTKPPLQPCLRD